MPVIVLGIVLANLPARFFQIGQLTMSSFTQYQEAFARRRIRWLRSKVSSSSKNLVTLRHQQYNIPPPRRKNRETEIPQNTPHRQPKHVQALARRRPPPPAPLLLRITRRRIPVGPDRRPAQPRPVPAVPVVHEGVHGDAGGLVLVHPAALQPRGGGPAAVEPAAGAGGLQPPVRGAGLLRRRRQPRHVVAEAGLDRAGCGSGSDARDNAAATTTATADR